MKLRALCLVAGGLLACSSSEPTGGATTSTSAVTPRAMADSPSGPASAPTAPPSAVIPSPPASSAAPPNIADLPSLRMRAFQRPRGPLSIVDSYRFYPDITLELEGQPFYLAEMSVWMIRSDHELSSGPNWSCLNDLDYYGDRIQRALLDVRGHVDGPYWCRVHSYQEPLMSRFAMDSDDWKKPSSGWMPGHVEANRAAAPTVVAWSEGRNLGLFKGDLLVVDGPNAAAPKLAPAPQGCTGKTRLVASDVAALKTGEVYVAGIECGVPDGFAIESFAANATTGTFTPLPQLDGVDKDARMFVRARCADEVIAVVASAKAQYVLRLEGGAWRATALPTLEGAPVRSVSLSPDGAVWLLLRDVPGSAGDLALQPVATKNYAVLRLDRRGAWAKAALDVRDGAAPILTSVTGLDAEHALVAGGLLDDGGGSAMIGPDGKRYHGLIFGAPALRLVVKDWAVLWSTGASDPFPPEPQPTPRAAQEPRVDAPDEAPETMEPYTAGCKAPFVFLFQLSELAPPDYPYPATRDAMKDAPIAKKVTFVEYDERGARRFGARVKDKADGDALIAQLKASKGMAPQLLVLEPIRECSTPILPPRGPLFGARHPGSGASGK
ncbi:MAG: hypothetical protein U0414_30015 [Polyangiaceae bacterium]